MYNCDLSDVEAVCLCVVACFLLFPLSIAALRNLLVSLESAKRETVLARMEQAAPLPPRERKCANPEGMKCNFDSTIQTTTVDISNTELGQQVADIVNKVKDVAAGQKPAERRRRK